MWPALCLFFDLVLRLKLLGGLVHTCPQPTGVCPKMVVLSQHVHFGFRFVHRVKIGHGDLSLRSKMLKSAFCTPLKKCRAGESVLNLWLECCIMRLGCVSGVWLFAVTVYRMLFTLV